MSPSAAAPQGVMSASAAAPQRAGPGVAASRFVPYRHVLHQHRAALLLALVAAGLAVVLVAGALVWSGPQEADRGWAFAAADGVRIALPLLGGVLVAGPMVAAELASGTYRMAWTQSVTPARWLAAKLAVAAGVLLVLTVPLSALLWWVRTEGAGTVEPALATTPLAYTLLAVAIGGASGLLVRHTSGAMTLAALALAFTLSLLRSQPQGTWGEQLTLTVPLLGCAVAAAGLAFLLVRTPMGDAS